VNTPSQLIKGKGITLLVISVVILLFLNFYWTKVRPASIRKTCAGKVREWSIEVSPTLSSKNRAFRSCLTQYGLEAEDLYKL